MMMNNNSSSSSSSHKLLILEGPAGGGKTTLARSLENEDCGLIDLHHEFGIVLDRPRDYGSLPNPKMFPLMKDTLYFMAALNMFTSGMSGAIMDRGFFSNLVYSTIRNDRVRVFQTDIFDSNTNFQLTTLEYEFNYIITTIRSLRAHFTTMMATYEAMSGPLIIDIEICFVVPPVEVIIQRRGKIPGKVYPFDVYQEYDLYLKLSEIAVTNYPEYSGGIKCSRFI